MTRTESEISGARFRLRIEYDSLRLSFRKAPLHQRSRHGTKGGMIGVSRSATGAAILGQVGLAKSKKGIWA